MYACNYVEKEKACQLILEHWMVEQIIHVYLTLTASTLDFYRLSGWFAGEGLSDENRPGISDQFQGLLMMDMSVGRPELSTFGWNRRSGRDGSGHDFAGFWRVGSAIRRSVYTGGWKFFQAELGGIKFPSPSFLNSS